MFKSATMASLQAWMKKEDVFDKDICKELTAQFGVVDPHNDFSKISKSKWSKFKREMIYQRQRENKKTVPKMVKL